MSVEIIEWKEETPEKKTLQLLLKCPRCEFRFWTHSIIESCPICEVVVKHGTEFISPIEYLLRVVDSYVIEYNRYDHNRMTRDMNYEILRELAIVVSELYCEKKVKFRYMFAVFKNLTLLEMFYAR